MPPPQKNFFIFYAEIMHFGAKFLLGFTMHSVNRGGGGRPPLPPLNPPLNATKHCVPSILENLIRYHRPK